MEPIIGQPGQPGASGNGGAPAGDIIKDSSTATFKEDVIDASMQAPVIVDFWAPWCGPCKQLTPVLESVVTQLGGAVRLVKVNIDENQDIAQQLRIQSIPAVFAFFQGRPVDGFQGALPESQVKEFAARLMQAAGTEAPADPVADALEQADERLAAEDFETAGAIYQQVLQHDATSAPAMGGLARCLVALGRLDEAEQLMGSLPDEAKDDANVSAARAALDIAKKGAAAGDTGDLQAKVDANPDDHQARFDLAMALFGGGAKSDSIDHLVEIVRRDRTWNDEAARKQILEFFDAEGPTSDVTVEGRRKLSAVLFS